MTRMRAVRTVVLGSVVTVALAGCGLGHAGREASAADASPVVASTQVVAGTAPSAAASDRVADVAERAVRAVVNVSTRSTERAAAMDLSNLPPQFRMLMPEMGGAPREHVQHGVGSGVIVDATGLVLTNHHVIDHADEVTVTLSDGRRFAAKVRATDAPTDLALLQLVGKVPADLPTLRFADSDHVRLGQTVLAIGSPFALQGTVTLGIVSARGRGQMGLADYEDFLQTDAAINPGNSGGALVDLDGALVGLNTAINTRSGGYDGIGFAIPSNLARDIMERLLRDGRVVRGKLGAYINDVDPAHADQLGVPDARGALIAEVQPGAAGDKAGLRAYDVVVRLDGEAVDDARDLRNTVALKGANTKVRLDVLRDGKPVTITATLGALEDDTTKASAGAGDDAPALLGGVRLAPLDDAARRALGSPSGLPAAGVVVTEVSPDAKAAEAGLRPGDVVLEVDRHPVTTPKDVTRLLQGAERAMILVQRGQARQILFLD